MTFDLLGELRLLTVQEATIARQFGLVNVDNIVVNGPIVIATGTPQSDGRYDFGDDNQTIQDKGSVIVRLDEEKQPTPASQGSENTRSISPFPVHFGIYIRFENSKWWEEAPEFLDIAKNLRIISITRCRVSVPSFNPGITRQIMIVCEGDNMTIRQGSDESPSLYFKNVHPRGRLQDDFRRSPDEGRWSLRRIRANEIMDLKLRSCNAVIYYSREFAQCVWLLVHHHRNRGEEAYILVQKKELTDG